MIMDVMRVFRLAVPVLLVLLAGLAPPPGHAEDRFAAAQLRLAPPPLTAQAAFILDDTTGRTLYAYHADALRYPASTVKMMTAIVALQHLNLHAIVTVPAGALVGGTSAGLWAGERMRVRDLLYGMLLPSGNDAAMTLADATAGSPWSFAALMNVEARRLHLWHTHFLTPNGFDVAGQYSTARDLAWLAHALLRRRLLAGIVRTRVYDATAVYGGSRYDWTNLDRLLWTYPGAIGVKTGTTPLAGANLVACVVRSKQRLIAVIMGSTVAARYTDATSLLNYGWRLLGYSA